MKKVLYLLLVLVFCTGCGPDFGDKIYDWISSNARNYSERLTRADLSVRWLKAFTDHYKTIAYHTEASKSILKEISHSTEQSEGRANDGLTSLLIRYDHSKSMLGRLVSVKELLERNDSLFQSMDSIGNGRQFEAAGLRAIGKETLMRSFLEIGNVQSTINKLRYQKLFSLKYAVVISEDGNVNQSVDNTNSVQGYSYNGSFEQFWYDNPVTGPLFSLFIRDNIEDQVDRIWEALDLYDQLCLKPEEQYAISLTYVNAAKIKYDLHHQMADSIQQGLKAYWSQLFKWNVARFKQAEAALQPYRLRLAEAEFQGSDDIQRVLNEETQFQLRQELVKLIGFVKEKSRQLQGEEEQFAKIEKLEALEHSIAEVNYILNTLKERTELVALYQEIEDYKREVNRSSAIATSIKNQLIRYP